MFIHAIGSGCIRNAEWVKDESWVGDSLICRKCGKVIAIRCFYNNNEYKVLFS